MGGDDLSGLWLEETPQNDPLTWGEPERRTRDHACGIHYFAEGYLTCPTWWAAAVQQTVGGTDQAIAAVALYSLIQADRFVSIPTKQFKLLGISRRTKYRMLALLEEASLIEVERANGRALRVRLVLPAEEG